MTRANSNVLAGEKEETVGKCKPSLSLSVVNACTPPIAPAVAHAKYNFSDPTGKLSVASSARNNLPAFLSRAHDAVIVRTSFLGRPALKWTRPA
ncbi:hypothetical protein HPB50_009885 [Hyalomma asiaticum]|uniref:Uncharacterized protein n=1 Tax=Hyalomma asiaticum TaxID=266040 RepID=A0ACB7RK49_HYAAI|nr:hypothetical protein HPB50_009885 [Hyalomma asiaticum]